MFWIMPNQENGRTTKCQIDWKQLLAKLELTSKQLANFERLETKSGNWKQEQSVELEKRPKAATSNRKQIEERKQKSTTWEKA